jgi:predicted RNA-binding protein with EMAP domain
VRSFAEWKAVAIAQLMALRRKYADKPDALRELENIISRIRYARLESLPALLAAVEKLLSAVPELESIVPSVEEVEAWHRSRQRGRTSQL